MSGLVTGLSIGGAVAGAIAGPAFALVKEFVTAIWGDRSGRDPSLLAYAAGGAVVGAIVLGGGGRVAETGLDHFNNSSSGISADKSNCCESTTPPVHLGAAASSFSQICGVDIPAKANVVLTKKTDGSVVCSIQMP